MALYLRAASLRRVSGSTTPDQSLTTSRAPSLSLILNRTVECIDIHIITTHLLSQKYKPHALLHVREQGFYEDSWLWKECYLAPCGFIY